MKRLHLGVLGGTLSMTAAGDGQGIVPRVAAGQLLAGVPGLAALATVHACTLGLLPSASLGIDDVLAVHAWASAAVAEGADAVVVTQGTDTLEETAFLLDLVWEHPVPLVLTGAMRGADAAGADGPGNLLCAAITALHAGSRARGVLVALHDRVHAAAAVRKVHSLALDAFASPGTGCVGHVQEGQCRFHAPAAARVAPLHVRRTDQQVALVEAVLGQPPSLLEAVIAQGCEGLVVAGMGAGHVPAAWVPVLAAAARRMPVVVATRTGAGATARGTYGFAGGEIDLQAQGVHMAGALCPRKCRLLLWALIGAGGLAHLPALLLAWDARVQGNAN